MSAAATAGPSPKKVGPPRSGRGRCRASNAQGRRRRWGDPLEVALFPKGALNEAWRADDAAAGRHRKGLPLARPRRAEEVNELITFQRHDLQVAGPVVALDQRDGVELARCDHGWAVPGLRRVVAIPVGEALLDDGDDLEVAWAADRSLDERRPAEHSRRSGQRERSVPSLTRNTKVMAELPAVQHNHF
jgi:hypothetical protein